MLAKPSSIVKQVSRRFGFCKISKISPLGILGNYIGTAAFVLP
jgi:hypothetical protein